MRAEIVLLRKLSDMNTDERVRTEIARLIEEIERRIRLMANGLG